MPDSSKAVFLSYASQDAEVVLRIAEALRASGVEVWFDKDELVGGDAWDAKIRGQIASCALFVPVISAATQARREGYFRIEWKLAAQRTHAMADGTPFLLPVVIDATKDGEALVPAEFRAVQWTRLRDGDDLRRLCARVVALLDGETIPLAVASTQVNRAGTALPLPAKRRMLAIIAIVSAAALAAAALMWRSGTGVAAPLSPSTALSAPKDAAALAATAAPARSVAVLPFVSRSLEAENDFLSDALTDEILSAVARVPGLRVPGRTSSFAFKGKTGDYEAIGKALRVATVLEGTVLRVGNQLRITAQLIAVADGYQLWTESYDREMTVTNIIAIQDDIARNIAAKLRITLTESATPPSARQRSVAIAAYEFLLKARMARRGLDRDAYTQAIELLKQATAIQPDYAEAFAEMAIAYFWMNYYGFAAPSQIVPLTRQAVARAKELDAHATASVTSSALALVSGFVERNWELAEQEFKQAIALDPANLSAYIGFAAFLSARGRHTEAIALAEKSTQLDPLALNAKILVSWTHWFAGNNAKAEALARECIATAPEVYMTYHVAGVALLRSGKPHEAIVLMEQARKLAPVWVVLDSLATAYAEVGRLDEVRAMLQELNAVRAGGRYVPDITLAIIHAALGDVEQANIWMSKAIEAREGRVVFLAVGLPDKFLRQNPHYPEWLAKIGLNL